MLQTVTATGFYESHF